MLPIGTPVRVGDDTRRWIVVRRKKTNKGLEYGLVLSDHFVQYGSKNGMLKAGPTIPSSQFYYRLEHQVDPINELAEWSKIIMGVDLK